MLAHQILAGYCIIAFLIYSRTQFIHTQTARQETDDYNSPTLALIIYA